MDPTFIPAWRKQSATPQRTFQTAINVFVAGKRRICCQNSFAVTRPSSSHTISGAESLRFGFPSRNLPFSAFIGAKRNRGPPKQIFWEIWKWCERLVTGSVKRAPAPESASFIVRMHSGASTGVKAAANQDWQRGDAWGNELRLTTHQ